jgi:MFS family permease
MISNYYNKLDEEKREGLVWGLVLGLVWGLVWGLVYGLVFGLVLGLVLGLVFGLVYGLVFGLVWGLVVILINFVEALPFINGFLPVLFLILGIIFLVELFFWLDKSKPSKSESKFKFTLKRKLEALGETLLVLSGIAQIYILIREGIKYVTIELLAEILKWIGYIGAGILGLGIIIGIGYLWIKLNERKYKR